LIPEYMVMGERGMGDMTEMEMPLPENTAPMMTGDGPFGSVEMGGMFSVVKVRRDQAPGDYSNPEWFNHPDGSVAREVEAPEEVSRTEVHGSGSMNLVENPEKAIEVRVQKPRSHGGHS